MVEEHIFRRSCRADRVSVRGLFQDVITEPYIFFQNQENLPQVVIVFRKQIFVKQVSAHPCRTERPECPGRTSVCRRRLTPQIHVMKTCCTVAAKICFCGLFSIIQKLAVHPHKRLDQLMQPARSRHPVVHLGVDVDRIIAVPRRQLFAVPESLQVGGHAFRARA